MLKKNGPEIELHFETTGDKIRNIEVKAAKEFTWKASGATRTLHKKIETWLTAYSKGENPPFALPLDFGQLPPFTKAVLNELSKLQFGQTASYKAIADRIGRPKAARAVGQACGRNPFLLVIPCHRILASDGSLGGFSSGLPFKVLLLAFEN